MEKHQRGLYQQDEEKLNKKKEEWKSNKNRKVSATATNNARKYRE